jgi:uncharacterized protein YbbC (DUF1343 family)
MGKRWGVLFLLVSGCLDIPLRPQVLPGIDVLKKTEFSEILWKKVGLITNQTGRSKDGRRTIDVLFEAPNVKLVALFAPEHGLQGTEDREGIGDTIDAATGLPVYSLYGKTRRPTDTMLKDIEVLIYDIQDVGARYYTYVTTMGYAMEEAAKRGIKFVILDRPAMVNGSIVEGDMSSDSTRDFIAYYPVVTRYGMTPGELARYYNDEKHIGCNLAVVKLEGWRRGMWYDETGLRWVDPSPNIRTLQQALLYSGLGCFEATNFSVGRGSKHPFEYYGAPYLNGEELAARLNEKKISGARFSPVKFVPNASTFKDRECSGVNVEITNRNEFRASVVFVQMAVEIKRQTSEWNYHSERFRLMAGSNSIIDGLDSNLTAEEILKVFKEKADRFQEVRNKYLLY